MNYYDYHGQRAISPLVDLPLPGATPGEPELYLMERPRRTPGLPTALAVPGS